MAVLEAHRARITVVPDAPTKLPRTVSVQKPIALGVAHNIWTPTFRGEFTRGETVANRHGTIERNVLHGDRYVIEGLDKVEPNAKVCTEVDADRFLQLLVSRIRGK